MLNKQDETLVQHYLKNHENGIVGVENYGNGKYSGEVIAMVNRSAVLWLGIWYKVQDNLGDRKHSEQRQI